MNPPSQDRDKLENSNSETVHHTETFENSVNNQNCRMNNIGIEM